MRSSTTLDYLEPDLVQVDGKRMRPFAPGARYPELSGIELGLGREPIRNIVGQRRQRRRGRTAGLEGGNRLPAGAVGNFQKQNIRLPACYKESDLQNCPRGLNKRRVCQGGIRPGWFCAGEFAGSDRIIEGRVNAVLRLLELPAAVLLQTPQAATIRIRLDRSRWNSRW
jgi:hypothetical protein